MLVIKVILQARPGKEKTLEEALLTLHQEVIKGGEAVKHALCRAHRNHGRFLLYGKYTDRNIFEKSVSGHHVQELSLKLEELIEEPIEAELYEEIAELTGRKDKENKAEDWS
jgi:quinol monooxygenase YgiN